MNRVNAYLEDCIRCIDEIFEFLPEKRDFFEYKKDVKTKKAVERNIEIIGEAVNRILRDKDCALEIKNAQKIIGTRNRIAHEYDNISDEIIWAIILRELPKLKQELIEFLNNS